MKRYLRPVIFFAIAAAIVLGVYLSQTALAPMSSMIAKERSRLARSRDEVRAEKDPAYARALEEKLHILGYQLAMAYNAENKPDKAIAVLQQLIDEERAKEKSGVQRNSRSYQNEARYYEAMAESYDLKKDENSANMARNDRIKLLGKASDMRMQESREEGSTMRSDVD